jgi:hypothetical protein
MEGAEEDAWNASSSADQIDLATEPYEPQVKTRGFPAPKREMVAEFVSNASRRGT